MGVEIQEIQDPNLLSVWYNLLWQTYLRSGVPLADISLFEAVFDILVPKGMAKFLLAKTENHYAAASLELPYKDVIYSWYAGFDWEYRRFSPNDVLVWHILKWGARNGYRYYDFGGAGQPNEDYGVRDFKAKYGGELVSFGRHVCVHSSLMFMFSKLGYQAYRGLTRILPIREK
jgi:lipid II:glycine glycyltransferase (peptidoglycan interpeptide bridge formation enzyme)